MGDDSAARLYQAFVSQDPAAAIAVIEGVRDSSSDKAKLFDSLFAPAMAMLGGAWAAGVIDEDTFTQASVVAEQVNSFVTPPATAHDTGITVLVGSMHRDVHSIDKNVIAAALREAGHRVIDLGVDVRPVDFFERAEETGARMVIVSAQMISTARAVSRIREVFEAQGRDDVIMLVSGGPFAADEGLARDVGANGVVRGAESALRLVERVARERFAGSER